MSSSLERLLSNPLYVGRVGYQGETYPGEQVSIVEASVWREAQKLLAQQRTRKRCGQAGKALRTGEGTIEQAQAPERVPRIARLMALALKFEQMMRQSLVPDYAVLAALGRVSRSRVTQIMNLLNLAPDIQERILFLKPETAKQCGIFEPSIRRLSSLLLWSEQRAQWNALTTRGATPSGPRSSESTASGVTL